MQLLCTECLDACGDEQRTHVQTTTGRPVDTCSEMNAGRHGTPGDGHCLGLRNARNHTCSILRVWRVLLTSCVCARAERGVAFNLRPWHLPPPPPARRAHFERPLKQSATYLNAHTSRMHGPPGVMLAVCTFSVLLLSLCISSPHHAYRQHLCTLR
jgi:hypothetical protein